MKNIITVLRRELSAYFHSPIGYIYLIVFALINSWLYIPPFFLNLQADMRGMFNFLPFLCCVLVPLISMRLWAEDRKENTIEMLLTFPMKPAELVLGKFFASLIFYVLALVMTWTIPMMLYSLGNPDSGIIFSSYLGAVLLGALFLALGSFFSVLVRDQIIAAVLSLAGCFGLYLLGLDFIATYLDSFWNGFGNNIKTFLGMTPHYESFIRGIISAVDVIYFLTWIAIFLFLTGLFLEGRNRPKFQAFFACAVSLCLVGGMLFNYLFSDAALGRFDCTEGKIYTVSDASIQILNKLKAPVTVNVYITPQEQMPTELKTLEQEILDTLQEMALASNKKMDYKVMHLEVKNLVQEDRFKNQSEEKDDKKKNLEETLLDKGVEPYSIRILKGDQQSTQLIYSSLGVAYRDKEEILPPVTNQTLYDLETQVIKTVDRLAREKKPIIAFVAPKDEIPAYMAQMYMQLGRPVPEARDPYQPIEQFLTQEGYDIKRVALTKQSPLPEEYDVLVIFNPVNFNERQKWEIAQALRSGKKVLMAVQEYFYNYEVKRGYLSLDKREEKPNVNDLLEHYGITIDDNTLMDKSHITLNVSDNSNGLAALFGGHQIKIPTHILVTKPNMNQKETISNNLQSLPYLWGTALNIQESKLQEAKLSYKVLLNTTPHAWKLPKGQEITENDIEMKNVSEFHQYPLMAMITGQFPEVYSKQRPEWPKQDASNPYAKPVADDNKPEPPAKEVTPQEGTLILLGCSRIFRSELIQNSIHLLMNCIEVMALDENLSKVRSHKMIDRRIDLPENTAIWKLVNFGLMPILLALIGIGYGLLRKYNRSAYLLQMQNN